MPSRKVTGLAACASLRTEFGRSVRRRGAGVFKFRNRVSYRTISIAVGAATVLDAFTHSRAVVRLRHETITMAASFFLISWRRLSGTSRVMCSAVRATRLSGCRPQPVISADYRGNAGEVMPRLMAS